MTDEIMRRFSLQPITTTLFPVAAQSRIIELVGSAHTITTPWTSIEDIAFVVPIQELESGLVHLNGASNVYFARFGYSDDGTLFHYPASLYFSI
jgi:hypothetical protein